MGEFDIFANHTTIVNNEMNKSLNKRQRDSEIEDNYTNIILYYPGHITCVSFAVKSFMKNTNNR